MAEISIETMIVWAILIALVLGAAMAIIKVLASKFGAWLVTSKDGIRVWGLFAFGFVVTALLIVGAPYIAGIVPAETAEETSRASNFVFILGVLLFLILGWLFFRRYTEEFATAGSVVKSRYEKIRSENPKAKKTNPKKSEKDNSGLGFFTAIFAFILLILTVLVSFGLELIF